MGRANNKLGAREAGHAVEPTPVSAPYRDFGQIKVRSMKVKQSEAIVFKNTGNELNFGRMDNEQLIKITQSKDLIKIRELSKWFDQTNGIYGRAVRYLADVYRFDFMLYPNIGLDEELKDSDTKKILKRFNTLLEYFDNSAIQLMCRKWANQVCLEGVYYGYICDDINDKLVIQDLPTDYCRSRFLHQGSPVIEFNVSYFDKITSDAQYRQRILGLFPDEFQKGYAKYKKNKLAAEFQGDDAGWILLDLNRAFKFNFYDNDLPPFLHAIPTLLALGEVQDLAKEKLIQEIQKIVVQKFDLDKNGQIPFTMIELQRLNQNAVDMVGDAVGVSVLSTVADVHLENLATDGQKTEDQVDAAENNVYNDLGISMNLFNTDGNLALEKSVTIDEAYIKQLLLQFERFFNNYISWKFSKKGSLFRLKMLNTTIFNYINVSDKYKDLTKLGFSRFLPMLALGHTQKEIISMAKLEQQIMQLDTIMIPPFSSNTMSSETYIQAKNLQNIALGRPTIDLNDINGQKNSNSSSSSTQTPTSDNAGGRPALQPDQRSDKTLANQASM